MGFPKPVVPFVLIRKGRNVILANSRVLFVLAENGIVVFVSRRTATNELKDFTTGIGYLVLGTGWNCDCVARTDGTRFLSDG